MADSENEPAVPMVTAIDPISHAVHSIPRRHELSSGCWCLPTVTPVIVPEDGYPADPINVYSHRVTTPVGETP